MPLIHFNERELHLLTGHEVPGDTIIQRVASIAALKEAVAYFAGDTSPRHDLAFVGQEDWRKAFTILRTGGGLVQNADGHLLLIQRLGFWDLPKGKLDEGETLESAALREVEEETGVQPLRLERPVLITWHTYRYNDALILKENHWFAMSTSFSGILTPQTEEDITACIWADRAQVTALWDGMYPAVQDVIRASGWLSQADRA